VTAPVGCLYREHREGTAGERVRRLIDAQLRRLASPRSLGGKPLVTAHGRAAPRRERIRR
jgi:hypothetical protein